MNNRLEVAQALAVVLALAFVVAPLAEAGETDPRYHLVTFPDVGPATAITDSGVILAGNKVLKPAGYEAGNPVWDANGDGVADGYGVTTLDPGPYTDAAGSSINESLDVVGGGRDSNGDDCLLLWLKGPQGYTLLDLGNVFTTEERQVFGDLCMLSALDINDLGQILVWGWGLDILNLRDTWALAVLTPRDIDGDGELEWFQDANGDGANDLMIHVEFATQWGGGNLYGRGSINNLGQVAARSNLTGRGFVVDPSDADGDGLLEWFHDADGDGSNDLATDLGPNIDEIDLSDSGVIVGTEINWGNDDYYLRWQMDGAGNVELVAKERGAYWMKGVNNPGQAVGYWTKYLPKDRYEHTAILWEPGASVVDLFGLLDNPSDTASDLRGFDISDPGCIVGEVGDKGFIAVPLAQGPPPPGITVEPTSGLVTTEGGGDATFSIVLDTQPTADVTIALSSSDTSEGAVEPTSITFTPDDWDTAQEVTVTGVDDADEDGDVLYAIVTAPADSTDPDYGGLDAADVDVVNLDDDAPLPSGEVSVVDITYQPTGPKGKDLDITLTVVKNIDEPVVGASVSIQVCLDGQSYDSPTALTGDDGTVTFKLRNAPSGTYTTEVTAVVATGLFWDGITPLNSYGK